MVQIGPSGSETTTATIDAAGLAALEHTSVSQEAATVPTVTTMQNAATANGNGTSLVVTGYATALLQATSSPSMSGGTTINFEGSADGGTTWVSVVAHQLGTSGSQITTATADADFRINCAGLSHLRARLSAYSAGTVTVKGYASPLAGAGTAVSISNTVTVDTELPAAAALTDADANPTVPGVGAYQMFWDPLASNWKRMPVYAEDAVHSSGDRGSFVLGVRNDSFGTSFAGSNGDYAPIATTAQGQVHVIPSVGVTAGDGQTNSAAQLATHNGQWQSLENYPFAYNATTWDRVRNNTEATILASAARTATTNGADQINYNGRGVIVVLNVTAQPGGVETLTVTLQGRESVSGNYFDIETSGILFTAATGTKALIVYPGVLAADIVAGVVGKSGVVPRTWRPSIVHSAGGSWTYSVSAVTLT